MSTTRSDSLPPPPPPPPPSKVYDTSSIRSIQLWETPTELSEHSCIIITTQHKFTLFIAIPGQAIQVFDIQYRPPVSTTATTSSLHEEDNYSADALDYWIQSTLTTLNHICYFIESFPLTFYVEHISNAHFILFIYFLNQANGDIEKGGKVLTNLLCLFTVPAWPYFLNKYILPNLAIEKV